jgi:transcriptional regulator with XRE-family HTH domain
MSEEVLVREFAAVVRRLRLEKGLSPERLAELAGLHRTYIGHIERAETTVTIVTANKLARALGVNLSGMFSELEQNSDRGDSG